MITAKSIEEVMSAVKIEDVIEDFVNLKRKGTNYTGLCPFHDEKDPLLCCLSFKGYFQMFWMWAKEDRLSILSWSTNR